MADVSIAHIAIAEGSHLHSRRTYSYFVRGEAVDQYVSTGHECRCVCIRHADFSLTRIGAIQFCGSLSRRGSRDPHRSNSASATRTTPVVLEHDAGSGDMSDSARHVAVDIRSEHIPHKTAFVRPGGTDQELH